MEFLRNLVILLCLFLGLVNVGHQKSIDNSDSDAVRLDLDRESTHENDESETATNESENANNTTHVMIRPGHKVDPQHRQLSSGDNDDEFACNPSPTPGVGQYIIGYGSLMSTESKDATSPNTGENLPVKIRGFSRVWNCKGTSVSYSTTYLGVVVADSKKTFVAAVYKLPNAAALIDYDTRESFYCREEVPMSKIQMLAKTKTLGQGQYWMYVTKPEYSEEPTREYPIVQSYVDTFLTGCFELEEKFNITDFAKDCIRSTEGWESPWVNDRIFPRRPFRHQKNAGKIDRLLNTMLPRVYKNIRIEG